MDASTLNEILTDTVRSCFEKARKTNIKFVDALPNDGSECFAFSNSFAIDCHDDISGHTIKSIAGGFHRAFSHATCSEKRFLIALKVQRTRRLGFFVYKTILEYTEIAEQD